MDNLGEGTTLSYNGGEEKESTDGVSLLYIYFVSLKEEASSFDENELMKSKV